MIFEPNTKINEYSLGRILDTEINVLGETTSATVKKGKTDEIIKRHATALIPLFRPNEPLVQVTKDVSPDTAQKAPNNRPVFALPDRPQRKAAGKVKDLLHDLVHQGLV